MRRFKLIEQFEHKGRTCVVIRSDILETSHNGYIQTKDNKHVDYDDYISKIETDELTYSGDLSHFGIKDKFFVGFDSSHYWNTRATGSQTFESVKDRTIKICEEMVTQGI